jgi:hypothetical protein
MYVKFKINLLSLIGACLAGLATLSIFNGSAQEVIYFADPLNEMATALMTTLLTIYLVVLSFEKIKLKRC